MADRYSSEMGDKLKDYAAKIVQGLRDIDPECDGKNRLASFDAIALVMGECARQLGVTMACQGTYEGDPEGGHLQTNTRQEDGSWATNEVLTLALGFLHETMVAMRMSRKDRSELLVEMLRATEPGANR